MVVVLLRLVVVVACAVVRDVVVGCFVVVGCDHQDEGVVLDSVHHVDVVVGCVAN